MFHHSPFWRYYMDTMAGTTQRHGQLSSRKSDRGFSPRVATVLLCACMFGSGASGLVNEYILCTTATYILGSSIEQFSFIIAFMMLMMGFANWCQTKISNDNLIEKFVALEIGLALLGGFAPLVTYAAYTTLEVHFAVVQYFFVGAIGFMIGFEIPMVVRINEQFQKHIKDNVGSVLMSDYVGSFVGALVWIHWLLPTFPLTESSFIIGGMNFFVAAVTLLYFFHHGMVKYGKICLGLMVLTSMVMFWGYSHNRGWNIQLEQKLYDSPIIASKTTQYQRLVLTHDPETNDTRLFINGNVQFSSLDEGRYHDLLVHPVMELAASRAHVLILGGGDGLALREVLKYDDVRTITLVDLDPEMTKFAAENPDMRLLNKGAFDDARVTAKVSDGVSEEGWRELYQETGDLDSKGREITEKIADVHVMNIDAHKFVDTLGGRKWGVVIIDFPDPSAIELTKLYSRQFYGQIIHHVLAFDGMIAVQSTSPYHAKEAFLCIQRTMEDAGFATIPYHANIPAFGDWGWFLAWPSDNASVATIRGNIAGLQGFSVETEYLTPDVFRAATVFGKGELITRRTEINTLMHPTLLDIYTHHSWLIN